MEFRLLGPLEVLSEGRSLRIGGSKQRGVLAVLLLHANEVVSTDRLIDEIWGSRPPKSVDASLQNCIWSLRKVLGPELIETRPPGYVLRADPGSIDALRFERAVEASGGLDGPERAAALREALALWKGPPLADLEFEGVARAAGARLDELRLAALEERLAAELELGRHEAILGELEALATRHPGRERLRELQMLALYRAGRQRDALRVYQEVRLELLEELGLEPAESLRTLERMIIGHDPALLLAPPAPAPASPPLKRNVVVAMMDVVDLDGASAAARSAAAAALAEIALVAERHEGTVRELDGEEIVVVFGAPVTHDDDTARALRFVFEARAAVPHRFVIRTAVERLGGEADTAAGLEAVRGLLDHAAAGDVLLGPAGLRLVSTAVDVVPHEAGDGYRILRFDAGADPFPRRLEAPIVGRGAELAELEARYADVVRRRAAGRLLLAGEAGVGKTRLAHAFLERIGQETLVLTGRCAAYGDGMALRPVLQILEQVGPADLVLAGLPDADRIQARLHEWSLSEPSESHWALRRLLEACARDRPVVVVFDDVHWAAPTFLDLVEYLGGWAVAPLFLLCVARTELLDGRPAWADDAIVLGPIAPDDAQALVAALPEAAALDGAAVAAAVDAAEGNPLFLEQLVVFAAEGAPDTLPPTLEVLIASRVGRLPEPERDALERAAVAGRHFWRSTVEAISPDELRATAGASLMALVRRRLIQPERASVSDEDGFRFQHALIRDAVYAGIPEPARAELHLAVARSLDERRAAHDETVGYHLEQAALLRRAHGASDRTLAEEAARRLGAAGVLALKRIDGREAVDLLNRALALYPGDDETSRELRVSLGMAYKFSGDVARADRVLDEVVEQSVACGDARNEHLARIEQVWPRLADGRMSVDDALELADRGRVIFERASDGFALGRAWHCTAAVTAVYQMRYAALETGLTHLRRHYERAGFPPGSAIFLMAAIACRGVTPVPEAIERCRALLVEARTPVWQSFILPMLAAMEGRAGLFDDARAHLEEGRLARREFTDTSTLVTSWSALAAEVELLAARPDRAEAILAHSCAVLRAAGDHEWLATNTAFLADALTRQGRHADALEASRSALEAAPPGHLTSRTVAQRVEATALARMGRLSEARLLIDATIDQLESTDAIDEQGQAFLASAEIHALAADEAAETADLASALAAFERKGNLVGAARVRLQLGGR